MKSRPSKKIIDICFILFSIGCFLASCKSDDKIIPGKYDPKGSTVTGSTGSTGGTTTGADSTSTTLFSSPSDVAVDAAGNIYVADYGNNIIQKITPAGVVSTLAGSGSAGSIDANGALASFNGPSGIALDATGNVYVADYNNNLIRKITPAGIVSTLAGTRANPADTVVSTPSVFLGPSGVAVDASGNVYVADSGDNQIKMVNTSGVVTTLAGGGNSGSNDGTGSGATFYNPTGLALDASNNLYVADFLNNLIRKVTPAGVVTTVAGTDTVGHTDGPGNVASFYFPSSLAVDASGNIYVTDGVNDLIREISPQGVVSTIAGSGMQGAANGQGIAASFNDPDGIAIDGLGNLYVADANNNLIRGISPAGIVTTLAGTLPPGVTAARRTGPTWFHSGILLKHRVALKVKTKSH